MERQIKEIANMFPWQNSEIKWGKKFWSLFIYMKFLEIGGNYKEIKETTWKLRPIEQFQIFLKFPVTKGN